jgi:hypothetical protein
VVVAEDDHADEDADRHAAEPRRHEATAGHAREDEPRPEQWQHVRGITADRNVLVVRELADRREHHDRDRAGESEASQKNLRTPRKSLVRTGTMRTSLAEFGDSIIFPSPMYMATWPTTGCS